MTLDRILREPEVARVTGLSRSTRWRLQREGRFPRPRKLSANAVGHLESEVRAWLSERAGSVKPEGAQVTGARQ